MIEFSEIKRMLYWFPDYFVDPENGRDSNDGKAPHRSFCTLAHALAIAKKGEVIVIKATGGKHETNTI